MFQNISGETDSRKKVEVNFIIFIIMADVKVTGKLGSEIGNVVTVDSPELINELIQNNEKTVKLLDGVSIKKNEISVSADGRVRIANQALFEKVRGSLAEIDLGGLIMDGDTNKVCSCDTVCGCNNVCVCTSLNDFIQLASRPKEYFTQLPKEKENILTRK